MKPRTGAIIALLLLATCNEETQIPDSTNSETARVALGKVPASEVATWQKVGSSNSPDGRYLQAAAFDEAREVFVMFGGEIMNPNMGTGGPSQETWEWSPATGKWTNRTGAGTTPDARSGAAMVYDSGRKKFVLFGGCAGSGYDYEDTWEWDPATGIWTDVTNAGNHPSARAHHAMAYEKSTGKVLLFGGGRSDTSSYDGTGITISLGDTWEWDPATHAWTSLQVSAAPSTRHDLGLVWDSLHNKAVLFAGMQVDIAGASGVPKRDTWEWDPALGTWAERTSQGSKPSARYAHSMAFDGSRGKVVVFGGWDISTGNSLNDVWDWDGTTGAWTERLTGSESNLPSARMYATMVSDDARARLEVVAGATAYNPYGKGGTGGIIIFPPGMGYGSVGSREVWELDPATATFTDRSVPLDVPSARTNHAMAYNPATGKIYVFGGYDMMGYQLDDLWEWDGKIWAEVATDVRPPARSDAAMSYDPARKSLILYGGTGSFIYGDTWEWSSSRGWTQLNPTSSPDPLYMHAMVTDTTRSKILLFGGMSNYTYGPFPGGPYKDPMRNEVWEWDGSKIAWTNRTPVASTNVPMARQYPILAYDEGRQKMFLFDGYQYSSGFPASMSAFWEWDPTSAGWALRDPGDSLDYGYSIYVAYDSIRKREVLLTDAYDNATGWNETWELDAKGPTWYVRALPSAPSSRYSAAMAFDAGRGVVVLFGGSANAGYSDETWEYRVTALGNGEGCTAAFASSCASGNCVEGVCCESAACSGSCKSCNVAGSEGTCVLAKAGTEVSGSCWNGKACDGSGNCKLSNGQACSSPDTCASGYCVDGVCCDGACSGTCASCNQAGRVGQCSPYPAGSDPQGECGKGTGVCKSTCDGVGSCAYPQSGVLCGSCLTCDGIGTCTMYDPYCYYNTGGYYGGTGGYYYGTGGYYGGSGGYSTSRGGSGGYFTNTGGRGGSGGYSTFYGTGGYSINTGGRGGSGGYSTIYGTGGYSTSRGGSGGYSTIYGTGGYSTSRGGSGGYSTNGTGGYSTVYGSGGTTTGSSGHGGSGGSSTSYGSGGKADGGSPKGGSTGRNPDAGEIDGITSARLHRSGCSCELGRAREVSSLGLSGPFILVGAGLLLRRSQRKKK